MPDWSEGSVFVALGIACQDKELILKGFKLIHEDGHKLAPALMSILHGRFKAIKVVESHETENEEQVLKLIAPCINDLENRIEDSKIVEAFLADISKDHH
jgi:hypothetical protein